MMFWSRKSNFNQILLVAVAIFYSNSLLASSPAAYRLVQESELSAKQKISSILSKYCGESCEVMHVAATVDETNAAVEELGFESVVGESGTHLTVSNMLAEIQVDDRVTAADKERLNKLIINGLRSLASSVQVKWSTVAIPQIGVTSEVEERLKQQIYQRISNGVQSVIDTYCSDECILSNIIVDGRLISPDDARGINERELVRDKGSRGILRLDNVDIDISIDEKISEENRKKIYSLLKARTKFAYPVNINLTAVDFPSTSIKEKSSQQQDPWGLDRLRQTLQIFRDLAGTKEIITNTTSQSSHESKSDLKSTNESQSTQNIKELHSNKESLSTTSSEKSNSTELSKASETSINSSALKQEGSQNVEYALYIGGFLLLAGIVVALIMRFSSAAKDAKYMIESANVSGNQSGQSRSNNNMSNSGDGMVNSSGLATGGQSGVQSSEKLSLRFKIESLREEILRIFTDSPKVARDVFTRMLQEDGVEITSKYVHVFGPLVVFELMNDPSLQRDIYDLSEYYHKSTFHFSDEQTFELLSSLKIKITASEIKLLTRRRAEQFDFLQNLDASQVYMLINEEKPQVQGIVLTQLNHQRRRAVFDMYDGPVKVALMRELCRADAIPKEYLANVAKALHRKVLSRNEFDTEQLRSNDILFDLLEKSPLVDQRALMADLVRSNPEAARGIKLKLVTVEMLPYLKDGHLLELVMGLEREDLLAFLVGSQEHIRDLLLSKAPHELAQSWIEDIEQMTGVEESTYRLAELKIMNRLRTLANNGAIRLLDINDRIFAEEHLAAARQSKESSEMAISKNSLAA